MQRHRTCFNSHHNAAREPEQQEREGGGRGVRVRGGGGVRWRDGDDDVTSEVRTGHELVGHEQRSDVGDVVDPTQVSQGVHGHVAC